MKNLLFFSSNKNKISEVKKLFKGSGIKLYSLDDFEKIKEPKETGVTFVENAKIKSLCGYKLFKIPCFADDSGICINALNDKPGVKSKRFFSKFLSKKNTFNHILNKTKESKNKAAYFLPKYLHFLFLKRLCHNLHFLENYLYLFLYQY